MNTLCWNCNHEYDITKPICPACDATNGNIDSDLAYTEIDRPNKGDPDPAQESAFVMQNKIDELEAKRNIALDTLMTFLINGYDRTLCAKTTEVLVK